MITRISIEKKSRTVCLLSLFVFTTFLSPLYIHSTPHSPSRPQLTADAASALVRVAAQAYRDHLVEKHDYPTEVKYFMLDERVRSVMNTKALQTDLELYLARGYVKALYKRELLGDPGKEKPCTQSYEATIAYLNGLIIESAMHDMAPLPPAE
ncbi:MAG: hypothetical protein PVJ92_01965 [Candidatus Dependentiae bacterium]|jgi:hypothetical protein